MHQNDKICFYKVDSNEAKEIIDLMGNRFYDYYYANNIKDIEEIQKNEVLNLIVSHDSKNLGNIYETTYCSLLFLDGNNNNIYTKEDLENLNFLYYLIKVLCRLSWVRRLHKRRLEEGGQNYRDSYVQIIDLLDELDFHSKDHSIKVENYAKLIGKKLNLDEEEINNLVTAALLHDIGKTIIPKEILISPNKLSKPEFDIIKLHTKMLDYVIEGEFSKLNKTIKYHHEKYNGSGYPDGLKEEEIPLLSRVLTILDSYDAMVSKRIYNIPVSKERAMEILKKDSGSHFDPKIVDVFLNILKEDYNPV